MKPLPDIDVLRRTFRYDEEDGALYWRVKMRNGADIGDRAGTLSNSGYIRVGMSGALYLAHRIIWKMNRGVDPAAQIDHVDGDRSNNRPGNLRLASQMQNSRNMKSMRRLKGAYPNGARWKALIQVDRKTIYLGNFRTEEEAHAAYVAAAIEHFGEFARAA